MNHAFRRNRIASRKGRIVTGGSPHCLFEEELDAKVEDYPMVTTNSDFVMPGSKKNEHN